MKENGLRQDDEDGVDAAFMRNGKGAVCITFDDPAYVRSESILVDVERSQIKAILHEQEFLLGRVSNSMSQAFADNEEALLTALMPDGKLLELFAPVQIRYVQESIAS